MRIAGCVLTLVMGFVAVGTGCQPKADPGLARGYAALDQKQYDQAMAAADEYLKRNPTGSGAAEAMYLKGRAIEDRTKGSAAETTANLQQARAHYLRALQLSPSAVLEAYLYTSLGNMSYWLEDYSSAESYWVTAHQKLSNQDLKAWVLYRLGMTRQKLGKWAQADAAFAQVNRDHPGTEAAARARGRHGARNFHVQVGAFKSQASADKLVASLRGQRYPAGRQHRADVGLHVVLVGPYGSYAEALAAKGRLAGQFKDALIIP